MSNIEWSKVESAFLNLFERQWYTNHGPLAQDFEEKLQKYLSVNNAVCVTNSGIALAMTLETLKLGRGVVIYGEETANLANALHWSNVQKLAHEIKDSSFIVFESDFDSIETALDKCFNMNCPLILDLTQHNNASTLETLSNVFSEVSISFDFPILAAIGFDKGHAIEAQGAACIATNSMVLAERLRNIRSSYGVRQQVPVVKTANGRMSEAQAVFGLISIGELLCD